jgi:uncharacterized protein (TIGR02453 family)
MMATHTSVNGFSSAATQFFEDLEDQNTREFWLAHKDVFEREIREPMAALLDSLPEEYQPFKVFRMNRDVRFSADKSPYKTAHGAAHGVPGGVYYLHLDASGLMVACGSYMMPPAELERYRQAVVDDSSGMELSEILAALRRRRSLSVGPGGAEPLKTRREAFRGTILEPTCCVRRASSRCALGPVLIFRTVPEFALSSWRPLTCAQISSTG